VRIAGNRAPRPRATPRRSRRETAGILLLVAWSGLVFAIGAATQATGFYGIAIRPLLEGGFAAPVNWVRARFATPVRLEIDMGFEEFQKLNFQREKALGSEALFASSDDYVPATIRSGDEDVKVKIRLKGDSAEHLQGEKWSFRVDVKGDHTLRGLKRFSLQHPATRNYLGEWIYHRALLREDVLGLRYEFVDLTLNGNHLGVYSLEEHFEKQLVEQKRRRDGPILRFDEELMWQELHQLVRPFGGRAATSGYGAYEASSIDGFKTDQTLADPGARKLYLHAVKLLEGFRRGELSTSEVFDTKRLATYFALTDLLGAEHGARWHNLRFYFNPITLRLEPIGFDAEITELSFLSGGQPVIRDDAGRLIVDERPFKTALFADRDFYALYIKELERVAEPGYLDALLQSLEPDLEDALHIVQREFPHIVAPVALLRANQNYMRGMLAPVAGVRADLASAAGRDVALDLGNLQMLPVEVLGIDVPGHTPPLQVDFPEPLVLEPRGYHELIHFVQASVTLPVAIDAAHLAGAQVRWRLLGSGNTRTAAVTSYSALATADERSDATRAPANLERFPFIRVDGDRAQLQPGAWVLEEDLIVPPGLTLIAGPGTRLDLRRGAKIVSRSPLEWRGSAEAPVELFSSDGTGQGLVVLDAGGDSTLEHARFRGLHPVDDAAWTLPGAVTFFQSPVTLRSVEFTDNPAEDAFNGIRTRVRVVDSVFRNTLSDAFDCDFCDVEMSDTRFENLGNDGIDVSGSTAQIDNVVIERAGDKGISTGEASDLIATNVLIVGANVGLASKDRSTLSAQNVTLRDCKWGIAAFQKKSEYGPAEARIDGFHIEGKIAGHLVQTGSRVTLDGIVVEPSNQQNIREILYGESAPVAAAR
jgi:hypothetical protein